MMQQAASLQELLWRLHAHICNVWLCGWGTGGSRCVCGYWGSRRPFALQVLLPANFVVSSCLEEPYPSSTCVGH